ncbi:Lrp/AsnC family transcriptional regulator [Candidatus Micrarchaeota archaeon]|nr:Lrp/AsnC family transcriptional regulator [Candidatus Micrarchaeota archaeon]
MKVDNKDKLILDLLSKNSRISNVEIAKKLDLTEGAVRSRIKKLTKSGVIKKFTIEFSEASYFAVVMIKSRGDTKKMMKDIASLNLHKDAYEISGQFDGCIILQGTSVEVLDAKIDKLRKVKGVADTSTFISFKQW